MPTEKRERQRAGRQARLEALARQQRRRRRARSSAIVVLVAAAVVGSVYLITRRSTTPKAQVTFPKTAQGRLETIWVKAGCPSSPFIRVNTLQFKALPAQTISATATYDATVKTDVGTFVITLDQKESPIAVNSFVFLAEHRYFNCNAFHRVVQGFVDQTGDPTSTGTGGPGYKFTEAGPPVASPQYPIGSVAMANSSSSTDPSTNGSQWFVVTGSQGESLPPNYVLLGQVTSGMTVLQSINADGSAATSEAGTPKVVHRILSVKIKEVPA